MAWEVVTTQALAQCHPRQLIISLPVAASAMAGVVEIILARSAELFTIS